VKFTNVYGVDFSGAKQAGHNTWIAHAVATRGSRLELRSLRPLTHYSGTPERDPALAHLVGMVRGSRDALWGMDFPFALPIEVVDEGFRFAHQLAWVRGWKKGAYSLGVECLRRAKRLKREWHIRRATDAETKAPFDCYHYRIIYQTFHGMRDVILPLARVRGTAILPFQYPRLGTAERVILESCPGSFLKRHGLPHNNYKQPAGGPLTRKRLRTRHTIIEGIEQWVTIPPNLHTRIIRNPGGDALDAVLAAVSAYTSFTTADHASIRRHPRYKLEGFIYA
jgi:hypothetical protein